MKRKIVAEVGELLVTRLMMVFKTRKEVREWRERAVGVDAGRGTTAEPERERAVNMKMDKEAEDGWRHRWTNDEGRGEEEEEGESARRRMSHFQALEENIRDLTKSVGGFEQANEEKLSSSSEDGTGR